MSTVVKTISSFTRYDGYNTSGVIENGYFAYTNAFAVPTGIISGIEYNLDFVGLDENGAEVSSTSVSWNWQRERPVYVSTAAPNQHTGGLAILPDSWAAYQGGTASLQWPHADALSSVESGLDEGSVYTYIVSGTITFILNEGTRKVFLGSAAIANAFVGEQKVSAIYLGSNLIYSAGIKTTKTATFSGTTNKVGGYTISKNLGIGIDPSNITITAASSSNPFSVKSQSYNTSTGVFTASLSGLPNTSVSGTITYIVYS